MAIAAISAAYLPASFALPASVESSAQRTTQCTRLADCIMAGALSTSCGWAAVPRNRHPDDNGRSQRGQPPRAARPERWSHGPLHCRMHALSQQRTQPQGMLSAPLLRRRRGAAEVQRHCGGGMHLEEEAAPAPSHGGLPGEEEHLGRRVWLTARSGQGPGAETHQGGKTPLDHRCASWSCTALCRARLCPMLGCVNLQRSGFELPAVPRGAARRRKAAAPCGCMCAARARARRFLRTR